MNTLNDRAEELNEATGDREGGRDGVRGWGRCGKVARLPWGVREVLNFRILDGWSGRRLVEWLNGLEEVKLVLVVEFGGRAISVQNLSQWRRGGYREWLAHREAVEISRELAEQTAGLEEAGRPLPETLSRWAAVQYAVETRRVAEMKGEKRWKRLREMCADVARLRRGDQTNRRLEIEEKKVEVLEAEHIARSTGRLEAAFEALGELTKENAEARAALNEAYRLAGDLLPPKDGKLGGGEARVDQVLSKQIKPNQSESK